MIHAFSSRTGQWEERAFVREGETTTVHDMTPWKNYFKPRQWYSVFWQGALFSLSDDRYQLIRVPRNTHLADYETPYLGKSKMGVSFGYICDHQLSVWILNESAGQMEWVLNYQHDLGFFAKQIESIDFHGDRITGPWMSQEDDTDMQENTEVVSNKDLEWDSDNDDFLPIEEDDDERNTGSDFGILGFHYKDVIFLKQAFRIAAYHLDSSKIQYLGYSRPKNYDGIDSHGLHESFVYTPCLIGDLHEDYIGQS
uniref:F-box associated domain-containing protein n=1 Tax=Oryza brachyantha TaxID=4533 RepID=J3N9C5_ORYBR